MPASGSSTFTDADGYQAGLRDLLDLLALHPRAFTARLTWVEFPSLRLLRAQESAPRVAYVTLPPDYVFVTFPTQPESLLIAGGTHLQFGDMMLHNLGERLHQRTTAATSWASIALPPASLAAHARAVAGKQIAAPAVRQVLRPHQAIRQRLLRFHARACRLAETHLPRFGNKEVVRALEQDLLWALVTCLTASETHADRTIRLRQSAHMVQFEQLLAEHPYRHIGIPRICDTIGISQHRLRTACSELLGMGPDRYQRLRRLKMVRGELMHSNPGTITSAAMMERYGFTDFHRFVVEYWNAYGEMPPVPPREVAD